MRILIVEDEKKLADNLKKALVAERFAVDVAHDGAQGYALAGEDVYDVILLDIGLPEIDGVELAKRIRTDGILAPIIMLTARDAIHNKIEGLDAGADDYIVKPFDFEELLARIRAATRKNSSLKSLTYTVDTLTLDSKTKKAVRAGQEITLSAKEYTVLEYLMRNSPQVLSKQQIIDHCWDRDLDPFSNTVDVYIGYVRAKVDKAFPRERPLVKTIKGLGYKIE